jgi:hypothetical protein
VKGNPGNPRAQGRPPRSKEQTYLDATVAAVPISEWAKVVEKALTQAKKGDAKAREWLGKMLVGSDPIPLAQLVEELQAEILRIKDAESTNGNGQAPLGRSAPHLSAGQERN